MPLTEGAVFAGYTIERLLGTGGMGEVYLVRHPRLPRREALKILPAGLSADAEYRQRFAREADNAAALWHPHIVAVHDRGEQDGQLWIAMDYVDGTDAGQMVRDRYPLGMPPNEAFDIVAAIADALDYAHERYLLHRDVKPANILLTDRRGGSRRVLLADFGIARAANETNRLTATNVTVGSIAYAAPEQLMGKALDGRADQYALACTAFHLLTGGPPFEDSNPAVVIGNHLSAPVPRLASVRADLAPIDDALATAMAKEPYQRFGTCGEFASALKECGAGRSAYTGPTQFAFPAAAPTPPPTAGIEAPSRESNHITISRRAAMLAGGVAALLAVGVVAFIGARLGQSDPPAPSASPTQTTLVYPEPTVGPSRPPKTVTETAPPKTVTQPTPAPPAPQPKPPSRGPGDLGLPTPISRPACNGQGIVVLGNITTPGEYASGIQQLLDAHPGASYLRTDQSCPSLRQSSDKGTAIYTVYKPAGTTLPEVCAAVHAAGGRSYGKWLDTTTDPSYILPC